MEKYPKVFIIILNYNGKRTLMECLRSIFTSDYPNFEVVVVDNNSTDNSFEIAKAKYPRIHFFKNNQNIGFGPANNIGMRFAMEKMADFVFLLNNDAYLKPATLSELVKCAQNNPRAGIISPLIIHSATHSIWFSGGKIDWLRMKTLHTPYQPSKSQELISTSEYISGCAMLIPQKVLQKTGFFDEIFFLYYEDADLSLRVKKAGFTLLILPQTILWHDEQSQFNPQKLYHLVLSGILFFRKHSPSHLRPWIFFYLWLRKIKNWIDLLKNKDNPEAQKIAAAYRDSKKY